MIRFENVSKRFPGSPRAAIDGLTFAVPEASTCVLLGPSGCGKSTSLRFVNRLVEPDAGRVLLGGRDVQDSEPVGLRRGIGYVLQGVGLFPHRTVAQNIATVPKLLGWPRQRIDERVDTMLDLIGLDPAQFRDRRPATLSGGQRQRVGVARALAADPPVLLMDEPFGAVDPIARARLHVEIGAILKRVRKTVLIVTHDIGEALLMADRIAILRDGRLVQAGTPMEILASPADAFVGEFLGQDRSLRRLSLISVSQVAVSGSAPGKGLPPNISLSHALSEMLAAGVSQLPVEEAGVHRKLTLDAIREAARHDQHGASRTTVAAPQSYQGKSAT